MRLSEVYLQVQVGMREGAGSNNTNWLSASRGYELWLEHEPRLGMVVLHAKHRSGNDATIPITNIARWTEAGQATEAQRLAALPQEMGPIRAEQARQAAAAQAAAAAAGLPPGAPPPPRDIRPTVKIGDLSATARQFAEEHGYVLIGGQQHRVVA